MEGLCIVGIIDHDSISCAEEFLEAAKMVDMPVTIGMEARVSMKGTRLAGCRTNNPDQVGVSYMTIQSVPYDKIRVLTEFFKPYQVARHARSRKMLTYATLIWAMWVIPSLAIRRHRKLRTIIWMTYSSACRKRALQPLPICPPGISLTSLPGLAVCATSMACSRSPVRTSTPPRQSFVIKAMENPMFQNLIDATWKFIEHEKIRNFNISGGYIYEHQSSKTSR